MVGKIKSVIGVFFRGAFGGWRGLVGLAIIAFSIYLVTGLFSGTTNIQNYIRNKRELATVDSRIEATRERLEATNQRIRLLQGHSPDFVAELAARHLNLGDPAVRILRR